MTQPAPRKRTHGIPRRSSTERGRRLAAQRQRRRRQLVKAGLDLFTIATDGNRLAEYLIGTGRIDEQASADKHAVENSLRCACG